MTVSWVAQPENNYSKLFESRVDVIFTNHVLLRAVVQINWKVSQVSVTEGEDVYLYGNAFGIYERPLSIGVVCSQLIASAIKPGICNCIGTTV